MYLKIKNLFKTKRLLIISSLSLILVLSIIIGFLYMRQEAPITPPSVWRGIIPGQTTQQEVINILGQPDHIVQCDFTRVNTVADARNCVFSPIIYRYKALPLSNGLAATHQIRFKSGKVQVVIEHLVGYPRISVYDFVRTHGLPQKVTWSKLGPSLFALLFCDQGFMLLAGSEDISRIYYFQPMSLSRCLLEFGNDVAILNPYTNFDVTSSGNPYNFDDLK